MSGPARSATEDAALRVRQSKLSTLQRTLIWGMVARGDRLQDVAYWFGVSPSTVHAIKKANAKCAWTMNDDRAFNLPPPGPYQLVQRVEYVALVDRAAVHAAVMAELEGIVSKYRAERATPSAGLSQLHS